MTDDELREMQERVAQIRELQNHPGWPVYEDWLRHKLSISQRRLNGGKIASLEDYREECGFIKGVTEAVLAGDAVEALVLAEVGRRENADQG